ncbi:hypothetical protein Back11_11050 [Paenibacillus baekrokdamisoli]|uniref:Uncharacterized protein n=1 Tax=Paenibacillus baekrokdamisoli TaxID=1712516 RepID=A0A3G9ILQ6_9BACL|nr:DUF309 domain-containing protein [Paenibacillus baekrokdamisoli]MBB3067049.1 hypothetical protein [Paenibacillus baekrokdamisoli]BBH19760.1 hypothetical protein Back11_11050 [Paenibacillus baekrokdamisoli]
MTNYEYPSAYIAFLVEFHATRDYFECHELLEEYWKNNPEDGLGDTWVGLIKVAVGSYHQRRGNLVGALKMLHQAITLLTEEAAAHVGLDGVKLRTLISARIEAIEHHVPFTDMELPIRDRDLLKRCQVMSIKEGLVWSAPSSGKDQLLHRHTLRDRSAVIAARAAAARAKAARNGINGNSSNNSKNGDNGN